MKRGIKIIVIALIITVILLAVANQILWTRSYAYAMWRVTHPFGPNVQAFGKVASMTTPNLIPDLIANVDKSDKYWISNLFKAWFPEARPPETNKQEYWNQWWTDCQRRSDYGVNPPV